MGKLESREVPVRDGEDESDGAAGAFEAASSRLEEMVNGIDGILWEADARTFRFTYVSRRAEKLLGYPVSAWTDVATFWADHIHPADREWAVSFCAAQTAEAKDHEFEYRMVAADGRIVWLRDVVWVETDAQGKATRLRGLMTDVTRRKDSERRLAVQQVTTGVLGVSESFDEAAPAILQAIGETLDWRVGFLWSLEGGRLRRRAAWAPRAEDAAFAEASRSLSFARGEGLPGRVLAAGRAQWVQDAGADDALPRRDAARAAGLRSAVAFPIRGRHGVLGVLEFFGADAAPADAELLQVLDALGTQVGLFDERRRAENALRESDARKGAILQAALDCIVTIDHEGRVLEWNPAAERTFGWRRDEAVGREMAELIVPPNQRDAHRAGLRRFVEAGEARVLGRRMEMAAMRKDGSAFPCELAIVAVPTEGPAVFTGFLRDITDRRRAEEALRESEHRHRQILDSLRDMVFTKGPGSVVRYANKATCDYYGMTLERLRGATDAAYADPAYAQQYLRDDMTVFTTGKTVEVAEEPNVRKDGEVRYFHTIRTPIFDTHGNVVEVVGVSRDVTERKQAEEFRLRLMSDVARQRERLDAIVASVPGVVWEAWGQPDARSQRIDFVSDHVEEMLGYTVEEWLSEPNFWLKVVHPDDRERAAREAATSFAGGQGGRSEFRWVAKDGRVLWVRAYSSVILDDAGKPAGMRGVTIDVTDMKRMEGALQRERALLETVLRQMPAGVVVAEAPSGRILLANDEAGRILRHPLKAGERLEQRAGLDVRRPDGSPCPPDEHPLARALARGETVVGEELEVVGDDGARRVLLVNAAPVRDASGRVAAAVADFIDVTPLRAAQRAAEESERHYRFLANAVPAQVWTAHPDGRLDYVNERAVAYFGRELPDVLGDAWMQVVHPDDLPRVAERWTRSLETGAPYQVEFRLRRHDGAWRWHIGRAVPLRDEAGRIVKWFGANADVSDLKEAQEAMQRRAVELARLAGQLERSNRELDQFAYVTSHDLKAPLRGIANLSRWIEEDVKEKLNDETRQHLDLLRGRVNRMESLIDAILEYSRVGRVQGRVERVRVGDLVREVADLVSPPEGFRVEVAEGMPELVTDRTRLQQVFLNLVANAVKHHDRHSEGVVRVGVEDAGAHWRFTVADDGPGIDPRFHQKVFVIFQTLQPRDKVEGTGVGLALVKKIVESHGGAVALESEEGKGATFRFTWPKSS